MKSYNPYVDVTLWPVPDLLKIAKEANLRAMTLAFLVADPEGRSLCWGGQSTYPIDWMQDQTRSLSGAGIVFDVSVGGATGQDIAAGGDIEATAKAYADIMRQLGPRFIDFDIEGAAVADVLQHRIRLDALQLANEMLEAEGAPPIKYTLTLAVMPSGLTNNAMELVEMCMASPLADPEEIRIMAMDYGSSFVDMGLEAIKAAEAAAEQVGKAVTVIPMIGQNDIKEEIFSLSDAQMLATYASEHPEVIAGLSAWSLGRDRQCEKSGGGVSPSCSGVRQEPYQFSGILGEV